MIRTAILKLASPSSRERDPFADPPPPVTFWEP